MTLRSRTGGVRSRRRAARARARKPAAAQPDERALYLYGIVRLPLAEEVRWPAGVGESLGNIFLLPCQQVAAVVSEIPAEARPGNQVSGLRRDMAAHAEVLGRLSEAAPVLPVRFGVCLPDGQTLLDEVLRPEYERLDEQLSRVAGAVELNLHVRFREEAIVQEIGREQPTCAPGPGRRSPRASFEEKLERGRRVVEAIQQRGRTESERLWQRLRPLAQEVQPAEPPSELTVLKAAFLVRRDQLQPFDRAVETLHEETRTRLEFEYVGPLPPYSFTRMRLALA